MTAKEKTNELIETYKFADIYFVWGNETMLLNARNCALLCSREVLTELNKSPSKDLSDLQFWIEVEHELCQL